MRKTNLQHAHHRRQARRLPSAQQVRAQQIGADELMNQAEWTFRHHPEALRHLRRAYARFCVCLLNRIELANHEHRTTGQGALAKFIGRFFFYVFSFFIGETGKRRGIQKQRT